MACSTCGALAREGSFAPSRATAPGDRFARGGMSGAGRFAGHRRRAGGLRRLLLVNRFILFAADHAPRVRTQLHANGAVGRAMDRGAGLRHIARHTADLGAAIALHPIGARGQS